MLGSDGKYYPQLAQVATKAVFILWTLQETERTDTLVVVTTYPNNSQRDWFEERVEVTGGINTTLTFSTNVMVLEAPSYKHNAGPLFKNGLTDNNSYFTHRAADEFNPPRRHLPGERVIRNTS